MYSNPLTAAALKFVMDMLHTSNDTTTCNATIKLFDAMCEVMHICNECEGNGYHEYRRCQACEGRGRVYQKQK